MGIFVDLTGHRFGRYQVVEKASNDKHGHVRWLCLCDCGAYKVVVGSSLGRSSRSCGCLRTDNTQIANRKHGQATRKAGLTKSYNVWRGIIQRCTNPKNHAWRNYGARGITVCERWLKFENFYQDMGDAPEILTLDRINNDLGYFPEKCRWATPKEQALNKRSNRLITFRGETKTLKEWSESSGLTSQRILNRLKLGWNIEKTLTTPLQQERKGEKSHKAKLTQKQVGEIRQMLASGMTHAAIAQRFKVSRTTISLINSRKNWKQVD